MGARSTQVFISPNMAVAGIYNTFPGELGLISEDDPPWKVGLINTAVQKHLQLNSIFSFENICAMIIQTKYNILHFFH